jgi:hypothetical protein
VDVFHSGRLRNDEILIAAVQGFTTEVVGGQILSLQMCSRRTVEDDDFFFQEIKKRFHGTRIAETATATPESTGIAVRVNISSG